MIIIIITAWIKNKKEEEKRTFGLLQLFYYKRAYLFGIHFLFSPDFLCLVIINAHFNLGRMIKREKF